MHNRYSAKLHHSHVDNLAYSNSFESMTFRLVRAAKYSFSSNGPKLRLAIFIPKVTALSEDHDFDRVARTIHQSSVKRICRDD